MRRACCETHHECFHLVSICARKKIRVSFSQIRILLKPGCKKSIEVF